MFDVTTVTRLGLELEYRTNLGMGDYSATERQPTAPIIGNTMTLQLFVIMQKFIRTDLRWLWGVGVAVSLLVLLGGQPAFASGPGRNDARELTPQVGTVSLVLGKAYVEAADKSRQSIHVGTPVHVTDRIVTQASGHVHIRFADDALVSVRPHSRLEVMRYDYNPQRPELSTVKFNLEEGVTRAISGDAAKSARDRFRLNTPIAAIGVRGTDFVVSASEDSVRALVTEGVIVMAPYSVDCSVDAFGPCANSGVELASASLQILELDGSAPLPRLLPAQLVRDPNMMRDETESAIASNREDAASKSQARDVFLEGVTSPNLTGVAEEVAEVKPPITTPPPVVTPPPVITPPPVVSPPIDFTPEAPIEVAAIENSLLAWGRFSVGQGTQERITLDYAQASAGRNPTVGTFDYGLFRIENGEKVVDKGLGVVSFSLNSAQAFYDSATGVAAMQVSGGDLSIDFQANSFATQLDLNHSATGPIIFSAAGRLRDGGFFYSNDDVQRITGAVSLDGSEAGYFFSRQLESGNIQGLTLWGSQ